MSNLFTEQIYERDIADEAMRKRAEEMINDAAARGSSFDVGGRLRSNNDALKKLLDMCAINEDRLKKIDKEEVLFTSIEGETDWYSHRMGYCIGRDKNDNFIAILPGLISGYFYFDNNGKKRRISKKNAAQFEKVYSVCRLLPERKLSIADLLKFLLSYLRLKAFFGYILLSVLSGVIGLIFPRIVNMLLGTINSNDHDDSNIWIIVSICVLAELISFFINSCLNYFESGFTNRVSYSVKNAALIRYLSDAEGKHYDRSAAEVWAAINNTIPEFIESLLSSGMSMIPHLIFAICYCISSIIILKLLSLSMFFVLIVFALAMWIINKGFDKWYSRTLENRNKGNRLLFQVFKGIEKIRGREAQKRIYLQWAGSYSKEAYSDKVRKGYQAACSAFQDCIIPVINVILVCAAVYVPISQSELLTGVLLAGLLAGEVSDIIFCVERMVNSKSLWTVISFLFDKPEREKKVKAKEFTPEVSVRNLSFAYPGMERLLDNISFEVKKGEYVGIVGMSGCGKSTLLKLLLGILKPSKGEISYGRYDLFETDQRSILQNIGIILQQETLIPGTIRQNMMMQPRPVSDEQIWKILDKVGIGDMIRSYPKGLDTEIGSVGEGMSGGQMQKLLIARAIVSKPQMIIFDEATSALDNVSQKEIKEVLDQMNCTRIVVAHRLSTVRDCDRIIVIDKEHISQQGTYDELISQEGLFRELSMTQQA